MTIDDKPAHATRRHIPGTTMYHTGVVVKQLEAAMEQFGTILDLTWRHHEVDVPFRTRAGRAEVTLCVAYSVEGPPHVELIEASESPVWGLIEGTSYVHHIGCWVDDLRQAVTDAERVGMSLEAHGIASEGPIDVPHRFSYHRDGGHVRVEFVDRSLRPVFQRWLEGGDWDR